MPFVVGEIVGQYQLIELLGQGGMATVFKAYHARLDRYVAIKALHPAFTEDPNFLARFEREAQLVARLEHPNIVPVYDFSEHEGRPYLVMKFVEGETLKDRMKEGALSPGLIYEVVSRVGAALRYAHSRGIVHRDVKPSNVLLGEDGHIYLADFGLARIAEAGESTISSDMMLGTPQYISPEQAMGRRDLDQRTDIYSFGVMIYEMFVGKVPFSADTPYSIIHDHIYTPLPLPRQENPEVPEAIECVLIKALEKKREDRYQSIEDMVSAFHHAMGEPYQTRLLPRDVLFPADAEPLVEPPQERLTQSAAIEQTPSKVQNAPQVVEEQPVLEQGKKGKKWLIGVGILALLCICLGLLVVNNRASEQGFLRNRYLVKAISEIFASRTPLPHSPDISIEEAQRLVDENPEDPYAYLQLAQAYWLTNQPAKAEEAFSKALQLSGDDPAFFLFAGDKFLAREMFAMAALMYRHAISLDPDPPPEDVIHRLHEALYRGAGDVAVERMLEDAEKTWADQQFLEVLRARGALLRHDLAFAREIVDRLNAEGYRALELRLLECELLIAEGRFDEARRSLIALRSTPNLPEWIAHQSNQLLEEIQR